MLIIRIELWPNGDEKQAKPIASMAIEQIKDGDYRAVSHELGIKEYKHQLQFTHKRQNSIFAVVAKAALKAARASKK